MRLGILCVCALLAASGCRGEGGGGGGDDDDTMIDAGEDPTPDAPENTNTACDPYLARPAVPEVLVGPEGLEGALLGRIDAARSTIDVLIYELTRPSFVTALIAAHDRGVAVRVLLDGDLQQNGDPRAQLENAGIEVKAGPANFSYYHGKALLFDGREAVIMSANLVWAHFEITRNYAVVDSDPDDVADVAAIFAADWAGTASPDVACTRLIVSPVNSRTRLLGLVNGATSKLSLAVMSLKDDAIVAAVKQRKAAGVDVRVLLPDPNWIPDAVGMAQDLAGAGVPVKYFRAYDLHAKLIIADDATAFVGSENMTWTSLNKNREVGVFVTEEAARQVIVNQFETDWSRGWPAP